MQKKQKNKNLKNLKMQKSAKKNTKFCQDRNTQKNRVCVSPHVNAKNGRNLSGVYTFLLESSEKTEKK